MNQQQVGEAVQLLLEARALGLNFERGNAYISKAYVEEQERLKARISEVVQQFLSEGVRS